MVIVNIIPGARGENIITDPPHQDLDMVHSGFFRKLFLIITVRQINFGPHLRPYKAIYIAKAAGHQRTIQGHFVKAHDIPTGKRYQFPQMCNYYILLHDFYLQ